MSTVQNLGSIVTRELLLYLDAANNKSYTSGSNSWIDLNGNRRNATIIGTTISGTTYGGYIETPASQTSTYVLMPESAPQALTNGLVFSIDWWSTMKDTFARYQMSMVNSGGGNLFIIVKFTNTLDIYGCTRISGSSPTYTVNVPHHLVVTSDGTNQYFYKNGVLTSVWSAPLGNIKTTCGWIIDQEQDGCKGSLDPSQNTYGWWHTVRLYNKCLTSTEVLQNYNSTKARFGL